jgi:uncharacterized protein YoxC
MAGYVNLNYTFIEEENNYMQLFLFIIALAVIILLIYLIPTLKQFRKTAAAAEKTMNNLERELIPLIQQTKKTMEEINRITAEISQITAGLREQIGFFEDTIAGFRSIVERTQQITSLVYDQVEMPIINVLHNINAIKKGISTFVNTLFIRRKEG